MEGCVRVNEVDSNIVVLDQDLALLQLWKRQILVLQNFGSSVLLYDDSLHSLRKRRHCARDGETVV